MELDPHVFSEQFIDGRWVTRDTWCSEDLFGMKDMKYIRSPITDGISTIFLQDIFGVAIYQNNGYSLNSPGLPMGTSIEVGQRHMEHVGSKRIKVVSPGSATLKDLMVWAVKVKLNPKFLDTSVHGLIHANAERLIKNLRNKDKHADISTLRAVFWFTQNVSERKHDDYMDAYPRIFNFDTL